MIEAFKNALVLCAHTDDEFGCGGTIVRLLEGGATVTYVALSRCEESVPPGFSHDVLENECRACTRLLGIPEERVRVLRFPVRHFPQHRQAILEEFVRLRQELEPDLILLPSSDDTHQDHRTVFEEGFRAFKKATILGYELPQNLVQFSNSAFVCLADHHLEAKIEALSSYESQRFRPYSASDFIRSLASVRGVQCGAQHAEAFELIRLVAR